MTRGGNLGGKKGLDTFRGGIAIFDYREFPRIHRIMTGGTRAKSARKRKERKRDSRRNQWMGRRICNRTASENHIREEKKKAPQKTEKEKVRKNLRGNPRQPPIEDKDTSDRSKSNCRKIPTPQRPRKRKARDSREKRPGEISLILRSYSPRRPKELRTKNASFKFTMPVKRDSKTQWPRAI